MPRYDYGCDCGHTQEVTHGFRDDPAVVCDCGGKMRRRIGMPMVSPSTTPTRSGSGIDMEATRRAEKDKAKDMDAYKRLRANGVQPPAINGSAKLESKAESVHEVTSGHTFNSAAARRRTGSLIDDIVSAK